MSAFLGCCFHAFAGAFFTAALFLLSALCVVAYNGALVLMRDFFNTQEVGGGVDGLQGCDVHG